MADNITKAELLGKVSESSGVSRVDAEAVLNAFFGWAEVAAYGGGQVSWPGFGSFKGVRRSARMARNPRTGAPVPVAAAMVMKFTPSSTLKQELNALTAPKVKTVAKKRPAAKKATKTTTKKAKKSAKKATKKTAKKATKKTAKKSTKKAPKKSAKRSAKKTTKKSARGRKR